MVYSTDRSKAVVPVLVLLFVALWFILRGDLFYVLPCVILFLCFSVLLVLRLPRLGKRELILVLFARLFDFCLFGFIGFLFLLVSGKGCGLCLLHSLDFSLTFFTALSAHIVFANLTADYISKMLIMTSTNFLLDANAVLGAAERRCCQRHFRVQFPVQKRVVSSPEHEVLMVSFCDRSMCFVRRQQFALNDISYTPKPFDSKLGRKFRGDL